MQRIQMRQDDNLRRRIDRQYTNGDAAYRLDAGLAELSKIVLAQSERFANDGASDRVMQAVTKRCSIALGTSTPHGPKLFS